MFTGKHELVVVWQDGSTDVYTYDTEEQATEGGVNMTLALGKQIAWCGVRPQRGHMTYKELVEKERAEFIGKEVIYKGQRHRVVDVDYNGGLLIDLPAKFTDTTAVSRFDKELMIV